MKLSPEKYLRTLFLCIADIKEHLATFKDATHQPRSYYEAGLFIKHSEKTIVPLESQLHRIQYDNHEIFVLEGYLMLATKLLENPGNRFGYFSLRVLYEIGYEKINVLFADNVNEIDRKRFKIMDTLSDLLGINGHQYASWFVKLLDEEKENLDEDARKLFMKAGELLKSETTIPLSILKQVRIMLNSRLSKYIRNVETPAQLAGKSNFDNLKIIFSHLLHGNSFTIKTALDPKFAESNKNHTLVFLLSTGLHIIIRLRSKISDSNIVERVDELIDRSGSVWEEFYKRQAAYRKNLGG